MSSGSIDLGSTFGTGGGGGGVTSLNGLTGALTLVAGSGITVTPAGFSITIAAINSGTVTSVALTAPVSVFTVTGSPITSSGTLALSFNTQSANTIFAGPTTGAAAIPTFRTLVTADLPFSIGNLTDVGTDGITITGGTGSVIGSGTSISQHVADTTHNGYLSSTDWNTFNNKQSTITIGALDAQAANANGLALVSNVLSTQSADATHPGMVNITTQTFAGDKTFTGNANLATNAASKLTVGNASSTAIHQLNGGINETTRTVTAATYSVDATTTDSIIYSDSTSNAITITLPVPTNGRILSIYDLTGQAGTNNITIKQHAAETINGLTQLVIARNYGGVSLTSNGTNWSAAKIPTSGFSFLTAGTTYTTPINITPQTQFKFTLIGGGGAGGGSPTTTNAHGAGGGGGGTCIVFLTGLAASTGYTMAIGAGGTGNSNAAGNNGGNTSITINATTYTANGGTGGSATASTNGGAGGTSTNGTMNITGGNGGACPTNTSNEGGGTGGSSQYGQGGQGPITAGSGIAGTGYGGGGSGSASAASGSAQTGGAGTQGMILVEWSN